MEPACFSFVPPPRLFVHTGRAPRNGAEGLVRSFLRQKDGEAHAQVSTSATTTATCSRYVTLQHQCCCRLPCQPADLGVFPLLTRRAICLCAKTETAEKSGVHMPSVAEENCAGKIENIRHLPAVHPIKSSLLSLYGFVLSFKWPQMIVSSCFSTQCDPTGARVGFKIPLGCEDAVSQWRVLSHLLALSVAGITSPPEGEKTVTAHPVNPPLPQEVGPAEDNGDLASAQPGPKRGPGRGRKAKGRRPGATTAAGKSKGKEEQTGLSTEIQRRVFMGGFFLYFWSQFVEIMSGFW